LILDQLDTALIPLYLPIGKTLEFSGTKQDKGYFLMLKQLNFTTIRFGLTIYANKELIDKRVGYVSLPALFFLGAESDDDDASGTSYLSTEYAYSDKDCRFAIRLGELERDELLVKLKLSCNDSTKTIGLADSPTMHQIKKNAR